MLFENAISKRVNDVKRQFGAETAYNVVENVWSNALEIDLRNA